MITEGDPKSSAPPVSLTGGCYPGLLMTCLVCEQADAQSLCRDIDPHAGKVQECLTSNRFSLSYDCQAELFRQEQEDSEDLRLSIRLFHKCLNDKIQVGHWCSLDVIGLLFMAYPNDHSFSVVIFSVLPFVCLFTPPQI